MCYPSSLYGRFTGWFLEYSSLKSHILHLSIPKLDCCIITFAIKSLVEVHYIFCNDGGGGGGGGDDDDEDDDSGN
jgi:hypothetical protein